MDLNEKRLGKATEIPKPVESGAREPERRSGCGGCGRKSAEEGVEDIVGTKKRL